MAKVIITGKKSEFDWRIDWDPNSEKWEAWIKDSDDPETGAPVLHACSIEGIFENIEIFEQGVKHATSDIYRRTQTSD